VSPGDRRQRACESLTVARDDITRRQLLRGGRRATQPTGHDGPVVNPGQRLPDVISWLDPEMRATPRRGSGPDSIALLRPPGAVAEADFLAACTGCGDCASACPHGAIRVAPTRLREAEGTPIVEPLSAPCLLCEDFPCIAACETGALRPEAPSALGTARVSPLDCLNRLGSPCSVCTERCPVPGAMEFIEDLPAVNERLCTGCGICQHVCPAPNNAILLLPNVDRPTTRALDLSSAAAPEIELPELHEGDLDGAGLRALFRDLSAAAQITQVRCKQAPGQRAEPAARTAEEALALILAGHVRGVQVRYRYEEQDWCDTVLAKGDGYRVVRVAAPVTPSGLAS
jgi:ferredoxin-type protein NapG